MFKLRRCVSCGARGWSPCPACVVTLRASPAITVDGARSASAVFEFEGPARDLIHAFKYHRARGLAKWFAPALIAGLAADIDLITWAPTTKRRRRERGYDQAELLAVAVGRMTGLCCVSTIRRLDDHPAQAGAAAGWRRIEPEFSPIGRIDSSRVALIDDVLTTGTTVASAVKCIQMSGAACIDVLVLAHTPSPNCA